jgi:hypothetical protein
MKLSYEEFLLAAREGRQSQEFWHDLQVLYSEPTGPLRVLVKMLLEMRDGLSEALINTHMVDEASIRKAVGTQGQLSGLTIALQAIYEAMRKPEDDNPEVSAEQRGAAP